MMIKLRSWVLDDWNFVLSWHFQRNHFYMVRPICLMGKTFVSQKIPPPPGGLSNPSAANIWIWIPNCTVRIMEFVLVSEPWSGTTFHLSLAESASCPLSWADFTSGHGKIRKSLGPHHLLCQNHRVWMSLIVTSQLLRVKSQFLLVESPFSMVQPWFNPSFLPFPNLSPAPSAPSRTVGPRTQRPRRHSAQGAGTGGAGDGAARQGGWGWTPSKTCGVKHGETHETCGESDA